MGPICVTEPEQERDAISDAVGCSTQGLWDVIVACAWVRHLYIVKHLMLVKGWELYRHHSGLLAQRSVMLSSGFEFTGVGDQTSSLCLM